MEFDVVISPGASADIDDLLRYVAVELCNPEAAAAIANDFEEAIAALETMPERYPLCKDDFLATMGYRKLSIRNYILIYRIINPSHQVLIVHAYHGTQDYEARLLRGY